MFNLESIYNEILHIVGTPEVRFITILISITSFAISLLAYRRTSAVMIAHERNMIAEQSRFLDNQWQNLNLLFITDKDAGKWAGEHYRHVYHGDARPIAMRWWLLNLLYSAYNSYKNKVIEPVVFDAHLASVASYFHPQVETMFLQLRSGFYSDEFAEVCEKRLAELGAGVLERYDKAARQAQADRTSTAQTAEGF